MKNFPIFLSLIFFFSGALASELPSFRVPLGIALNTLDPSEAEDFITLRVVMNLGLGLVKLDKNLRPFPGLATWKISADQKTVSFTLKKTKWSDGTPVKARDFVKGLEHTFSPLTTAKLAGPLLDIVVNAKKYKKKEILGFATVGIKALDDYHLEFKLIRPATYFLALLGLPMSFPRPSNITDFKIKIGSVTNGSYQLKKISHDLISLEPNPNSIQPAVNQLEFKVVKDQTTAMALYEKGELDFLDRIPSQDFDRVKASSDLRQGPWLSTYYFGFNVTKPPFNDLNARKAFVEAVNRPEIVKVLRDVQTPATSWLPAPFPTSSDKFGPQFDPVIAKADWLQVAEAPKKLTLFFDSQEKNVLIATRLQKEMKDNLNLDIDLRAMEWKSYLQFLKQSSPSLFRFAWLASFPDPLSHLEIFKSNDPNNYTGYKNPEYDALVDEIAEIVDSPKRTEKIRMAQKILLTDDVVIMPLFHYVQYVLIQNRWKGLDLTPMGILDFHLATPSSSL